MNETIITGIFIVFSMLLYRQIEKRTDNIFVLAHILFVIGFFGLVDFFYRLSGGNRSIELVYYVMSYGIILWYLIIFSGAMIGLEKNAFIPNLSTMIRAVISVRRGWIILSFYGWIGIKAYLVRKYGVLSFDFSEGDQAIYPNFYAESWERPLEFLSESLAVGSTFACIIRWIMQYENFRKEKWLLLGWLIFNTAYVVTHAAAVGPRRYLGAIFLVSMTCLAFRKGLRPSMMLVQGSVRSIVLVILLVGGAIYYQEIRYNYLQPEVAAGLQDGTPTSLARAVIAWLKIYPENERVVREVGFLREGPIEIIALVAQARVENSRGTEGEISREAMRAIVPRIISGKSKSVTDEDEIISSMMGITPDRAYRKLDFATSLVAITIADVGLWALWLLPVVMAGVFACFMRMLTNSGTVQSGILAIYGLYALHKLIASGEADLVSVLVLIRDAGVVVIISATMNFVKSIARIYVQKRFKSA